MRGDVIGRQVAEVIASDLRSTGMFTPWAERSPLLFRRGSGNPAYPSWRNAGVAALVSGYIEPRPDGRITLACYLHDVTAAEMLVHQGFAYRIRLAPGRAQMRRPVYSRLSGQQPYLDTRVVYVAETGPKNNRQKRVAIMDSDGSNHRY
jgi:TolB protein